MTPTLVASRTALPPEGVVPPKGGLSAELAPTLVTAVTTLPSEGAVLAWGGPARRTLASTLVTARMAQGTWRWLSRRPYDSLGQR
jgi:hypothetical protein